MTHMQRYSCFQKCPSPSEGIFVLLDVLSELTNTLRAVNKTSVPAILNKSPMVEMSRPLLILSLEINTQYQWLALNIVTDEYIHERLSV